MGSSVVLAKDFAPQDGLRFDRGLEGVVTAIDHDRSDGKPYMIVFFRDGGFEGDHAWLAADDLAPDDLAPDG